MTLRVFDDNLLVKEPPTMMIKTSFGLVIPSDQTALQIMSAEVLSAGPGKKIGKKFRPTVVKVGDIVAFSKAVATKIVHNKEKYLLIHEDDIVGICEDKLLRFRFKLEAKLISLGLTQLRDMISPIDHHGMVARQFMMDEADLEKLSVEDLAKISTEPIKEFSIYEILKFEDDTNQAFKVRISFR